MNTKFLHVVTVDDKLILVAGSDDGGMGIDAAETKEAVMDKYAPLKDWLHSDVDLFKQAAKDALKKMRPYVLAIESDSPADLEPYIIGNPVHCATHGFGIDVQFDGIEVSRDILSLLVTDIAKDMLYNELGINIE